MRLKVLRIHLVWPASLIVLLLIFLSAFVLTLDRTPAILASGLVDRAGSGKTVPVLDNQANNVIVALAPLTRTSPVELVALTLDANISESDGHTIVTGNTSFKLHNTDVTDPVSDTVGFPEWAGGALSFDPTQFSQFQVTLENKKVSLTPAQAPVKIGKETRTVNWYAFTLNLDPDEKQIVSVDFTQDLGTGIFPRFTYGLLPSNGWKGSIGSARLSIHLPAPTQGDQFIALDPSIPQFDGQNLNWLWTDFDPPADPGVTLIRISLWNDLLNRRSAVAGNPNDPNLHLSLARLYQQLASIDTPRRDNFMSQAVAELETAARLNPKNVDAVSTLAQLYETRAGPASGPRDANYVALALTEWQSLIGTRADAQARKQAAEDSFYLGVDARSRCDNTLAYMYFADAANFAPQGAGPLYTKQHWQTELQATHLALAQTALQSQDIVSAISHARAAYGNDFDLSPAPSLPGFALDRATIRTSANERQINLRLLTYPGPSDDAKKALDQIVANLNRTNAARASLSATDSDYNLALTVPFSQGQDLENRLHALVKVLPEREDWDVIRGVLDTPAFEWSAQEDTFTLSEHYREEVDLASGQTPLQTNLNEVSQIIGQLESAPSNDGRAQLRLALLKDAQQWWERAMTVGAVTYEFQPTNGTARQWTVRAGEKTTLSFDSSGVKTEWYWIGGGGAVVALLLLTALYMLIRRLLRRAPRPGASSPAR